MLSDQCIAFFLLAFQSIGYCHKQNNNNNNNNNRRIRMYNAEEAINGQFPFVAFLLRQSERKFFSCSCVIIEESWVMTAMHCIRDELNPRKYLIIAGEIDLGKYLEHRFKGDAIAEGVQERRGKAIYRNPGHFELGRHDLGLVKVDKPFLFGETVASIPLVTVPLETITDDCIIAGYGLTGKMKKYRLHYLDKMAAKPASKCRYQKQKDIICLSENSRGICKGDSGGPLICSGFLRGIASHTLTRTKECGRGMVEQYYSDVYANLDWIINVIVYSNESYHPHHFNPIRRQ